MIIIKLSPTPLSEPYEVNCEAKTECSVTADGELIQHTDYMVLSYMIKGLATEGFKEILCKGELEISIENHRLVINGELVLYEKKCDKLLIAVLKKIESIGESIAQLRYIKSFNLKTVQTIEFASD